MTLSNQTILITGGTSGLGFEMAKQLIHQGNKVIVCARTPGGLAEAKQKLPQVEIFQCDISIEHERVKLLDWVSKKFPKLNIVINNAAIVHKANFFDDEDIYRKCVQEINTNFIAPVHLIKLLLPVVIQKPNAIIINITTGLVYVPRTCYPFYNSTKSALHSFTQVLRNQLQNKPVKIVEVLFPVVNTPWHRGKVPQIAISPVKAVDEMMAGLRTNKNEIRVGRVTLLFWLSRIAPAFAFRKINSLR